MIRKQLTSDVDAIVHIWYDSSTLAHPFLDSTFVEQVRKDMRELYIPNSETWVFVKNEKVVGFIAMMKNEIAGLFVLPKNQSDGIGTQLVDLMAEKFDKLEVEVFEKNSIGRAFYQKYGFVLMQKNMQQETGEVVLRLKYSN
jgi:putative acetyltransferase